MYFEGDSNQASLNPALNVAMLMARYAPLATTTSKTESYNVSLPSIGWISLTPFQTFAQRQLDYALGKNPLNAVYVVGQHPNSPQNPHSAPASGGNNVSAVSPSICK